MLAQAIAEPVEGVMPDNVAHSAPGFIQVSKTRISAARKKPRAIRNSGVSWVKHEVFMDVSDPAIWSDASLDLVCETVVWKNQRRHPGGVQIRIHEDGKATNLSVWTADGEKFLGDIDGKEMMAFLCRGLARALTGSTTGIVVRAGRVQRFERLSPA